MRILSMTFLLSCALVASGRGETLTIPHVRITYEGADAKWAKAIAETIAAARTAYLEDFGFDMPDTVHGEVTVKAGTATRLYTDGNDRLYLSVPTVDKLARPAKSGTFNLYGMCHELGHMAMYRTIKDRDWMSGAAAEGWAHYAGSVVTDRVFEMKGESLWPDRYDYRADGTARLEKQLEAESPDDTTKAAGQWQALDKIIGRKSLAKLFTAWQDAEIDSAKAADSLLPAAVKLLPDKKAPLTAWWKTAGPLFVKRVEASELKAVTITASKLTGRPVVLEFDDDQPDGKKSIAGGGHARKFTVPEEGEWYIRAVSVRGAQYGRAKSATFDVALCDQDLKPISVWKKSYAAFERGEPAWTRLAVTPTRVPSEFAVCLNFRPNATQGVYVAFDTSTKGDSVVGVPGNPGEPFAQGDWMIRVELDRPKATATREGP